MNASFLLLPPLALLTDLALCVALIAACFLALEIIDLKLELKQSKLDGEKRQHWFDQYRLVRQELDQRIADEADEARRFDELWKVVKPEIAKINRERKALGPDHRIGVTLYSDSQRRAVALLLAETKP